MTSAIDDIYIMNLALRMCKITQNITSRNDGTAFSRDIAFGYDTVKQTVLSEIDWNCAVAFRQLSKTANTPQDPNFRYEFLLPSDMLTARELLGLNNGDRITDYEILDDNLYANRDEIVLRYTRDIDESQMPPWFQMYLAASVALELGTIYLQDGNDINLVMNQYMRHKQQAYDLDAEENPLPRLSPQSSLIAARYYGPEGPRWFWE